MNARNGICAVQNYFKQKFRGTTKAVNEAIPDLVILTFDNVKYILK